MTKIDRRVQRTRELLQKALIELINQKRAGQVIPKAKVKTEGNVINLMDALRRSVDADKGTPLNNLFLSMLDRVSAPADRFGDSTGKFEAIA